MIKHQEIIGTYEIPKGVPLEQVFTPSLELELNGTKLFLSSIVCVGMKGTKRFLRVTKTKHTLSFRVLERI